MRRFGKRGFAGLVAVVAGLVALAAWLVVANLGAGQPKLAEQHSVPTVAVPAGAQPAGHYDRVDFEPGNDTPVTLAVVVPSSTDTFALSGEVFDFQTYDPIAGATVTLGDGLSEAQTKTDGYGGYAFADMPLGSGYRLVVKAPGRDEWRMSGLDFPISDGYERPVELESGP